MFKALIIFCCTYNYQHYIYLMSMSIYFIFEISIVYNFANKFIALFIYDRYFSIMNSDIFHNIDVIKLI